MRLALGDGLGLGGCLIFLDVGVVVRKQAPFFGLGASAGHLEELDSGCELVVDSELLVHAGVGDTHGESRDDGRLGDAGDLVAHFAEALHVLAERLPWLLAHNL